MANIKFANFAKTILALGCTDADTTINVADASIFPALAASEYFMLVLENANLDREIVKCTLKASNALTVVRAQEGTTALAWDQGDRVALRMTSGAFEGRIAEAEDALDTRMDAVEAAMATLAGRIKIGEVLPWFTEVLPTGYLECDGSAISRTTYASLFAVFGERYGPGDGSTNFNLPDLRGEFIRGYDSTGLADIDSAARTDRGDGTTGNVVGAKQPEQFKAHTHEIGYYQSTHALSGNEPQIDPWIGLAGNKIPIPGNGGGGLETRPRNVTAMFVVRYA